MLHKLFFITSLFLSAVATPLFSRQQNATVSDKSITVGNITAGVYITINATGGSHVNVTIDTDELVDNHLNDPDLFDNETATDTELLSKRASKMKKIAFHFGDGTNMS